MQGYLVATLPCMDRAGLAPCAADSGWGFTERTGTKYIGVY